MIKSPFVNFRTWKFKVQSTLLSWRIIKEIYLYLLCSVTSFNSLN